MNRLCTVDFVKFVVSMTRVWILKSSLISCLVKGCILKNSCLNTPTSQILSFVNATLLHKIKNRGQTCFQTKIYRETQEKLTAAQQDSPVLRFSLSVTSVKAESLRSKTTIHLRNNCNIKRETFNVRFPWKLRRCKITQSYELPNFEITTGKIYFIALIFIKVKKIRFQLLAEFKW